MVGIWGGVPGTEDIRLGDVVVSLPQGAYGGVVQYDFGRDTPSGSVRGWIAQLFPYDSTIGNI